MGEGETLFDRRRNGRNDTVSQIVLPNGRFHSPLTPLERFASKCRFDPTTGCVLWTGGKSNGGGRYKQGFYGVFKHEGQRWFAHRWAAVFIHNFDITGLTVDHYCPHTADGHPNPLCVEHVKPETLAANVAERNARHRAAQSALQKQFWLLVDRGIEPPPAITTGGDGVPFFTPPAWLVPFMPKIENCPF